MTKGWKNIDVVSSLSDYQPWINGEILTAEWLDRNSRYQSTLALILSRMPWSPDCYGLHPAVGTPCLRVSQKGDEIEIEIGSLLFFSPGGRVVARTEIDPVIFEPTSASDLYGLAVAPRINMADASEAEASKKRLDRVSPPYSLGVETYADDWESVRAWSEERDGIVLARVKREGEGYIEDPNFVPPCMSATAHPRLLELSQQIIEMARLFAGEHPALDPFWSPSTVLNPVAELSLPAWYIAQRRSLAGLMRQQPFAENNLLKESLAKFEKLTPLRLDQLSEQIDCLCACWDAVSTILQVPRDANNLELTHEGNPYCYLSRFVEVARPVELEHRYEFVYKGNLNDYLLAVPVTHVVPEQFEICYHPTQACDKENLFHIRTFNNCTDPAEVGRSFQVARLAEHLVPARTVTIRISPECKGLDGWILMLQCNH